MVWNRARENEVGKATSGRLESKHYQESYLDALLGRKTHIIFSFLINFFGKSSENRKALPSIWLAVFSAAPKMPTHCSVPLCIKKGYREKETGEKVSSNFPPKKG